VSTLKEIVDKVKSNLESGFTTDETRLDDLFIESKIHSARGMILSNLVRSGMRDRINESFVQAINPDLLEYDEECEMVSFECPSVIHLDDRHDGFAYVGHVSGMKPFMRIRSNYTALSMHSLYQKETQIAWDFVVNVTGSYDINVYKNHRLRKILIRAIFNNPTAVPNYRKDVDQYPLDAVTENEVVEMISVDLLKKITVVAPDYISDSQNTLPRR